MLFGRQKQPCLPRQIEGNLSGWRINFSPGALASGDTAILVALPSELNSLRREVRMVGQPAELAGHRISIGYRKGEKVYIVKTGAGNLNSAMTTQALLTRYRARPDGSGGIDRVISIGVAGNLAGSSQRSAVSSQLSGTEANPTTEMLRQAQHDNSLATVNREPKTVNPEPGDLFIATDVINHQAGKETPDGFETGKGETADRRVRTEEFRRKCEELRSNAVEVARQIAAGMPLPQEPAKERPQAGKLAPPANSPTHRSPRTIHQGRLVSGDSFIASTAKRTWLYETFHADAVDMVSAGIARVCEANGVPYVIIRTLSDIADENASADFAAFVNSYKDPVTTSVAIKLVERLVPKTQ